MSILDGPVSISAFFTLLVPFIESGINKYLSTGLISHNLHVKLQTIHVYINTIDIS